jgi:hypothetical protein
MALTDADIHAYAAKKVNNKNIAIRVKNSAKLHSLRSAFSSPGSFASKSIGGVLAIGRNALSFIPIPAIGSFSSATMSFIEDKVREKVHGHKISTSIGNDDASKAKRVKFELKELSVEELDRYRWKLEASINDLNKEVTAFNNAQAKADQAGKVCDPLASMAIAIAQVTRRRKILGDAITEIEESLARAKDWSNRVNTQLDTFTQTFNANWRAVVERDVRLVTKESPDYDLFQADSYHANCGDFCYFNSSTIGDFDPSLFKRHLISVTNIISTPFDFQTVVGTVSVHHSDYHKQT